jgi:hypothetical protein
MKLCPLLQLSELSSVYHAINAHHRHLIAEFWVRTMFCLCGVLVGSGSCTLKYGLAIFGPNTTPPFPPTALLDITTTSYTAPPLHVCFKGVMVDFKAWAGCMSSLTQLVCRLATPLIA